MFRLIRWLCFPIAIRIGWPPIRVYVLLVVSLIAVRTMARGGPEYLFRLPDFALEHIDPAVAPWILPTAYGFALIVFPAYAWLFDKRWWVRANSSSQ